MWIQQGKTEAQAATGPGKVTLSAKGRKVM